MLGICNTTQIRIATVRKHAEGIQSYYTSVKTREKGPQHSTIPGPEVELLDKEIPHHTLHLAETGGEGCGLVSEGLDEARLVLLPEQTENEGLLTGLNDFMSAIHKDACGKRYRKRNVLSRKKCEKQAMQKL